MPTANKTDVSAAELELKRRGRRRLIGAITLGVLAVVILPMIFDSEPKKVGDGQNAVKQEISIDIPPKEGLTPLPVPTTPTTPTAPVAVAPTPTTAPAQIVAPPPVATVAAVVEKAPPKNVTPEPKPAPVPVPAVTKDATKEIPKAAPAKPGSFVVQIGAYKDSDNAKAIITQMKEAKLPVFSDTISVKTGKVTRVRLGPFATKEKAEAALLQAKLTGVTGKVVPQ
jgi:DedD protein